VASCSLVDRPKRGQFGAVFVHVMSARLNEFALPVASTEQAEAPDH
jgi:hypothetical protein